MYALGPGRRKKLDVVVELTRTSRDDDLRSALAPNVLCAGSPSSVDDGTCEDGPMIELRVLDYSFYPTVSLGGSQIIRGVCRPMFGRCARRVTARSISNEDLDWFMKREGHVWHVLHNRPHPGFLRCVLQLRARHMVAVRAFW